jgi:hypothetical protein
MFGLKDDEAACCFRCTLPKVASFLRSSREREKFILFF